MPRLYYWARAAQVRKFWQERFTNPAPGERNASWRSTVQRFPKRFWKANYLAMKKVHTLERSNRLRVKLNWQMKALFFLTRSAICPCRYRQNFSAFCRKG